MKFGRSLVCFASLAVLPALSHGQCVAPFDSNHAPYDYVKVKVEGSAGFLTDAVAAGLELWNDCFDMTTSGYCRFPQFGLASTSTPPTVFVQFQNNPCPIPGCVCATSDTSANGESHVITIYPQGSRGADCQLGNTEWMKRVIAHEIGHYLGLDDATQCAYGSSIMAGVPGPGSTGNNVTTTDCQRADHRNETPDEFDFQRCDLDPSCDPYSPCWSSPGCSCPLVLDLDRNQFHFSGKDEAVWFDIDVDGAADRITWTSADSGDAFLCWDRNRNGSIDDGTELFGTGTPRIFGGYHDHGYEALAELDSVILGGNEDRLFDERDSLFDDLCLWTDRNRDAIAQIDELVSLHDAGVVAIDLEYRASRRRDQHGNTLRYHSKTWLMVKGKLRSTAMTDVFFVEIE